MKIRYSSYEIPGLQYRASLRLAGWNDEQACIACNISLEQLKLVEGQADNLTTKQLEVRLEAGIAIAEALMLSGVQMRFTEGPTHSFYDCVLHLRPTEEVVLFPGLVSPRLMTAFRCGFGMSVEQVEKVTGQFGLSDVTGFEGITNENLSRYPRPSLATLTHVTTLMRDCGVFIIDEALMGLPEWGLRFKVAVNG